jgi:ribosomal protein S7
MSTDKKMNANRVINESQLKSYQKTDEDQAQQLFHIFEDALAAKKGNEDIQILGMGGGSEFYSIDQ